MAEPQISDAELARRCRQADASAWRTLIRRCSPTVFRVALRMLRSQSEAEDASQEVFLRIHKAFGTYDPTRPLTPWVSRITYNVCLQRLRRVKREGHSADPEILDQVENGRALPEEEAAGREATDLLLLALDDLSAQDQALLTLRYREGLSDTEVAEAVGMPVNTVKTRIFRARGTLKKRLAPVLTDR